MTPLSPQGSDGRSNAGPTRRATLKNLLLGGAGLALPRGQASDEIVALPPQELRNEDPEAYWARVRSDQFLLDDARRFLNPGSLGVAPRPVLLANAVEDTWANPAGQFEVLRGAEPVYRLLGAGGVGVKEMPEPGRLVDSALGYYIRPGQHSMTPGDWKVFLDFADRHLGRK